LLRRYGSLEGIYAQVPAMRRSAIRGDGSLAAKLEKDVSLAGLSKRLATVSIDAPITVSLDALRYRGPDDARIAPLFARLGFKTLQSRVSPR
jgi:DNA polymerase-1